MTSKTEQYSVRLRKAVRAFWTTRSRQSKKQGRGKGDRDAGNRTAATGGKQLDGVSRLFVELLAEAGIPRKFVFFCGQSDVTLPGFFRPTKKWDVLVVVEKVLLAAIECKSLCGPSFGNNYNNRIEEAIGNAQDIWTAYRDGAFQDSPKPFLAYFFLLEDADKSRNPVRVQEQHFEIFKEFRDASYAQRCAESLRRLTRERCYDATCLILSRKTSGRRGDFSEPAEDLSFGRLATLLTNHTMSNYRSLD